MYCVVNLNNSHSLLILYCVAVNYLVFISADSESVCVKSVFTVFAIFPADTVIPFHGGVHKISRLGSIYFCAYFCVLVFQWQIQYLVVAI